MLNHFPQVSLVNMNSLLEKLRIFASVGIMSAKVVTTTKHRVPISKGLHILEMSKVTDVVLLFLLLALNIFHTFFPCFQYAHVSRGKKLVFQKLFRRYVVNDSRGERENLLQMG